MKRLSGIFLFAASVATFASMATAATKDVTERLHDAATVFSEVTSAPDKGIPHDLIQRARCIVIVPGLKKGAFIVGAKFGKGFISCRGASDMAWSAPAAIRVEGGSFGFQIGGEETDAILLVMNDGGERKLLSSQFTLGGEGEVAAGPVGRDASAQTDAKLTAEILSYSRSRGVFAGLSLQGATLREDEGANEDLYGSKLSNKDIVSSRHARPEAARELMGMLDRYSPMEKGK